MAESSAESAAKPTRSPEELAQEIKRLAVSGDFQKAEKLRAHLLEVHPMALSEIVSAAEVIESEKASQIDHRHLQDWDDLYGSFSMEEKNCFFYATKGAIVKQGKLLFAQGKPNRRLFLICSGRVTLFHKKGEERHLIGQLSRGDIVGEESLLDISYATFSAGCQTDVELRYLERNAVGDWEKTCPALESKLKDYCLHKGRSGKMMKAQDVEKRAFERFPIEGRVSAQILTAEKEQTGKGFKGFLQDLSRNGLSFDIRLSRRETAEALLGRLIELDMEKANPPVYLVGRIVRVGFHLQGEYGVHVKLDRVLPEEVLQRIVRA